MSTQPFVHLRLHSEFSIVDSTLRIGDAVALAAKDDQTALAITDLNNLFGFVKFYKAARAKGIKPICGVDAWIESFDLAREPTRVLLLAESRDGRSEVGLPPPSSACWPVRRPGPGCRPS